MTTRDSIFLGVLPSTAALALLLLTPRSAEAQPGNRFARIASAQVTAAMPAISGCLSQLPTRRIPRGQINADVTTGPSGVTVRLADQGIMGPSQGCVEYVIANALSQRPFFGNAATSFRVVIALPTFRPGMPMQPPPPRFMQPPPPPPPTMVMQPAQPPQMMAVALPYNAGQTVEIQWSTQWYPGRVLAAQPDGTFLIHYDGWSDSWNEAVPSSRLRIPGGTPVTSQIYPQSNVVVAQAVTQSIEIHRELNEGGRFRIGSVNLAGQGPVVRVEHGGVIQGTATLDHNCAGCAGAINQVIVSLANDTAAQACVWNGGPTSNGPQSVTFQVNIPDAPGVYEVRARYAQAMSCNEAVGWWRVDRPNGPDARSTIGVVIVGNSNPPMQFVQ